MMGWEQGAGQVFQKANSVATDAFTSIRVVAAYGLQSRVHLLYEGLLKGPAKDSFKRAQLNGAGFGFSNFTMFALYALAFWYGGKLISQGQLNFADLLKVRQGPKCRPPARPVL